MKINIFFISLIAIIIAPGAYVVYSGIYSYSFGAMLSSLFVISIYFLNYKNIKLDKSHLYIFLTLVLFFLISIYSYLLFDWFDFERFLLSYLLLMIYLIACTFFVALSQKISDDKLYKYITIIFYIVAIDGVAFLIYKIFNPRSTEPLLTFFPEVSHFSLIFLPLLLFKLLSCKNNLYAYSLIIGSLIIVMNIQNLTMLVGLFFVMLIYSIRKSLIIFFIPIVIFVLLIGIDIENLVYYTDRLQLNDTENISALVFLSGWERALLNISENSLFGIGFNQLGYDGKIGDYQNKIASLGLSDLNIKDGGSLAPKLVAEFGFFGIILLAIYLVFFFKLLYKHKIKRFTYNFNYLDTFYYSIFMMSSVCIFLRNSGYFSPIIFLLLCSIIYLIKKNINGYSTPTKKKT